MKQSLKRRWAEAALASTMLAAIIQLGPSSITPADAQVAIPTPTQEKPAEQKPEAPVGYWDTLKLSGHIDFGATFNPNPGDDDINFGHAFTDKANRVLLNQLMLTAERPIDPKSTDFDIGFKFQGMYGSDSRYTHFLYELARNISEINQFDIVEANVVFHLPTKSPETSVDVKIGQYSTPLGVEVIDSSANYLYSHSYIFNYGLPFKHTGALTTTHANEFLDIYLGGDTGTNTGIARGDNNGTPAFLGGFGLNLLEGNLTILALTHIGPELPKNFPGVNVNSNNRYYNDVAITYKPNDKLTFITELNYVRDKRAPVHSFGVAQYGIYNLSDELSLIARGEIFNDIDGTAVGTFVGNRDFVNSEIGLPISPRDRFSGQHTLYGALTLGVNWKPPVPDPIKGFVIRPEIRFDKAFFGANPFDGRVTPAGNSFGTSDFQFTAGVDVIIPF